MVDPDEITLRLPERALPLSDHEKRRVAQLIADATELIEGAFQREHRNLEREITTTPWLEPTVKRVIREMVSAAIVIGGAAGIRSVSSTTGQESDSVTYSDVGIVGFSGVKLTDDLRRDLGLGVVPSVRGNCPPHQPWPERRLVRGWRWEWKR